MTRAATASGQTAAAEDIAGRLLTVQSTPTVVEALSAVMGEVLSVRKDSRNESQGFSFRGVDAVMNAVGPAFRKHGIVCVPIVEDAQYQTVTVGQRGTPMRECTLRVRYVFHGPAGDTLESVVQAEALDSGDKATSKCHSVAYRTCLLQALTIPTDEPDPDAVSHERTAPSQPVLPEGWRTADEQRAAWDELRAATKALPEDESAEVVAWVKQHVPNLGAFTAALADEWRQALPAEPPAEPLPLETT